MANKPWKKGIQKTEIPTTNTEKKPWQLEKQAAKIELCNTRRNKLEETNAHQESEPVYQSRMRKIVCGALQKEFASEGTFKKELHYFPYSGTQDCSIAGTNKSIEGWQFQSRNLQRCPRTISAAPETRMPTPEMGIWLLGTGFIPGTGVEVLGMGV